VADPVPSAAALAAVEQCFADRFASGVAPSLVYGALAGGGLVASGGFGTLDGTGTAPTVHTAYRLASITKSFTAAALLWLRDAGGLSLDAPVTDFLPASADLRRPTADAPVPTLRMLATMSGGLPHDDPWADRQEAMADAELDALLAAGIRFPFVPGTRWEYSNLGYTLLGRAIQVAAGRSYHAVVEEEILAPLGLASTGFSADVAAPGGVAVGHHRIADTWVPLAFTGRGAFSPLGGLFSTVTDLTQWMQFFIDGHRGRRGGPLSPATRREMQQGYRMIPPGSDGAPPLPLTTAYGFGLVVEQDPVRGEIVSHSGGYPGFSAHMRWHPVTGLGVVAFENATYAGVSQPATVALGLLLDDVGRRPGWEPWPETLAAQAAVMALLRSWDDALAERLFSDNVALDEPYDRRRAAITAMLARAGALGEIDDERGEAPSDRSWRVRGEHADLRCEIALTPLQPPRVQTLEIKLEPRGAGNGDTAPAGAAAVEAGPGAPA
jgi:CubicO group peptidase (beta-lactamase class C family)